MLSSIARPAACTSCKALRCIPASISQFSTTSSPRREENAASSSAVYLNAERKRKLISLYHQAGDFINYDNLSEKIDEAFRQGLSQANERKETSRNDLRDELSKRQEGLKFVTATAGRGGGFSDREQLRTSTDNAAEKERRVRAALFGLDDTFYAGLETVDRKLRERPKEEEESK